MCIFYGQHSVAEPGPTPSLCSIGSKSHLLTDFPRINLYDFFTSLTGQKVCVYTGTPRFVFAQAMGQLIICNILPSDDPIRSTTSDPGESSDAALVLENEG